MYSTVLTVSVGDGGDKKAPFMKKAKQLQEERLLGNIGCKGAK